MSGSKKMEEGRLLALVRHGTGEQRREAREQLVELRNPGQAQRWASKVERGRLAAEARHGTDPKQRREAQRRLRELSRDDDGGDDAA